MSALRDAMEAIRSIILIEERVRQQGEKVEKLAALAVDIDRRLVRVEAVLDLALRRAPERGPLRITHEDEGGA
ncbi:hypothetical protein ACUSIJ_02610 [Pseudochelatococcus sp. B33]